MTVWDIARDTGSNMEQFAIHCGNFLDEFYRASNEQRRLMVGREPEGYPGFPDYVLPFLAAMVHKLCNDYNDMECPAWVHKERYVLKEPHFWLDAKGNLRLVLLAESPVEFKIRNLYVTANTLSRA
ncbi:MAG TPA: hypothetical protein VMS09_08085 [Paenibacillus sp.]|uniref:hypothetical protein n=1 Tax=Paenibacillus sp. TaxID=58172 RepID=UPI002BE769E2|nr:hypothetical protein [Paenibacillus sp.]HUC91973.1 hypothetical protein [Paenibacillus sp.]